MDPSSIACTAAWLTNRTRTAPASQCTSHLCPSSSVASSPCTGGTMRRTSLSRTLRSSFTASSWSSIIPFSLPRVLCGEA